MSNGVALWANRSSLMVTDMEGMLGPSQYYLLTDVQAPSPEIHQRVHAHQTPSPQAPGQNNPLCLPSTQHGKLTEDETPTTITRSSSTCTYPPIRTLNDKKYRPHTRSRAFKRQREEKVCGVVPRLRCQRQCRFVRGSAWDLILHHIWRSNGSLNADAGIR
jgi:hypothetical protein